MEVVHHIHYWWDQCIWPYNCILLYFDHVLHSSICAFNIVISCCYIQTSVCFRSLMWNLCAGYPGNWMGCDVGAERAQGASTSKEATGVSHMPSCIQRLSHDTADASDRETELSHSEASQPRQCLGLLSTCCSAIKTCTCSPLVGLFPEAHGAGGLISKANGNTCLLFFRQMIAKKCLSRCLTTRVSRWLVESTTFRSIYFTC